MRSLQKLFGRSSKSKRKSKNMANRARPTSPLVRSVCISMVRNEQDVIETFLRHNHVFFDAIVLFDNNSADRTREIAVACAAELKNVFVSDIREPAYEQSQLMTRALHAVQSSFFADFICFLDADEFIDAKDRSAFDKALEDVPVGSAAKLKWATLLPGDGIAQHPLAAMNHIRADENPVYSKCFPRLGGKVWHGVSMDQGNHKARGPDGKAWKGVDLSPVRLLHAPVRSAEQLITKSIVGTIANNARSDAQEGEASQWKNHGALLDVTPERLAEVNLRKEALGYAQDTPTPDWPENAEPFSHGLTTELRHSDGSYGDPKALVAAAQNDKPRWCDGFVLPGRTKDMSPNDADQIENAFEADWHWDHLFLDASPISLAQQLSAARSVLDVGCGNGVYLHLLKHLGASDVHGVDGVEHASTILPPEEYDQCDLQKPYDLSRRFDMAMCLEVVEHIHAETTQTIVNTIAEHAKQFILFSMAEPGQPGNGHINCKDISEVLSIWKDKGWAPDLHATLAVRAVSSLSWFRRNLLVLRPQEEIENAEAARKTLSTIGSYAYKWYGQTPDIMLGALEEPTPEDGTAYYVR